MWQVVLAAPLVVLLVAALLPVLLLLWIGHLVSSAWLAARARLKWPPDKFALLAYTNSEKWAPYIERELLPRIGTFCVVVNRSEPDWKRRHPLEARVIRHWGGRLNYNPIVIVFPRAGRPRTFRLYRPFLNYHHGKPEALSSVVRDLTSLIGRIADVT
jgi:hypothetical protein